VLKLRCFDFEEIKSYFSADVNRRHRGRDCFCSASPGALSSSILVHFISFPSIELSGGVSST
jgi:hypothetical protein